jgi:uncharacterized membrane protein YebE (DUF533 family)
MDTIKIILAVIGVIAVVIAGIWLIGIVSAILWFALWIGLLAAIGYGGYKLLLGKKKTNKILEEKTPIAIADMQDTDRALEEYKRKYLSK